ncbi:MAG TPA: ABC transporter substrate-binding protein, partial [Candidatus Lustribacter sp.]
MVNETFRPTRRGFVAGSGALLGAFVGATTMGRSQAAPLRLNIFGGVDAWPVYVMHEKAFLDFTLTPTPGSVAQFQHMMAGDADLALTAMDNIVAYDEGQGDPTVAGPFDLVGILGIGPGFLKLVVRPDVTSYEQLRGKALAVDAPGTGFSFVLRRMLEKNGIPPGQYSFVAVGSTQRRFDAMVAGKAAGGVVSTPFDLLGQQKYGFHVLSSAIETLGHYQATAIMVRRSWAAAHRPAIVAFVRAYRQAVAWLYDPVNRTEAAAILVRNAGLPAELVTQIAPAILGSATSYARDGRFDLAGVNMVLELRSAYATPKKELGAATKYIDQSTCEGRLQHEQVNARSSERGAFRRTPSCLRGNQRSY